MRCISCATPFEVTPIDFGKTKFCKNCGTWLYKNDTGSVILNTIVPMPNLKKDAETELFKQEQILKQRQLEIQQKQQQDELELQRQFEIQRQKNIEYEKQRQLELEQKKQAELEKKRQLEIIQQRQVELEKQKAAELEKQKQDEILKQQVAILEEKVKQQKEEELHREKEIKERELQRQKEYDLAIQQKKIKEAQEIELKKQKEKELILQQESERKNEDEKERKRQEQIEAEILKSSDASGASNESENESNSVITEEKKSNKVLYFIVPFFLLAILSAIAYFKFPDKIKALFGSSPTVLDSATIAEIPANTNSSIKDTTLIEQLKADLVGKQILSWNVVKTNEINNLTIKSFSEIDKNSSYIVEVNLDDNAGTKAMAELALLYNKIILSNVTTNKITYKNTAPTNAWFSFEPIANCNIFVNTNNNPIQLKTCDNCDVQKINTNAENALQLATHPTTIYISSDTKYAAEIDFIYIPFK